MSEDITWCGRFDCTEKDCRRNPCNIRRREIPHSYALLENTEDCYKKHRTSENKVDKR